jgi:hypothetical protein
MKQRWPFEVLLFSPVCGSNRRRDPTVRQLENEPRTIRFEPGPAPFKSFTLTFAPAENSAYRVTADGETSDGVPIKTSYLLKEDGTYYPVTNAPFDSIAVTNEKSECFSYHNKTERQGD